MPWIEIKTTFPDVDSEANKKFRTYLFFLRHFDKLVRHERDDSGLEQLLGVIVAEQRPLLTGMAQRTLSTADLDVLRKMLFNAWNSETVARINSLFAPEVRLITNQWKPIQTYYAVYFLLATVHTIFHPSRRHSHEATLRFAHGMRERFPVPWSCLHDYDARTFLGFPWSELPQVPSGWNLSNMDPHTFVAHFYRTTGQGKRHERWLEHGKGKKHPRSHPTRGRRFASAMSAEGWLHCGTCCGVCGNG